MSLVGSGTDTAWDAAGTRQRSIAGSKLGFLRIHPPRSGERFGRNVRPFLCAVVNSPALLVEDFLQDFPAGRGDLHGARDVLAQVRVHQADHVTAPLEPQPLV